MKSSPAARVDPKAAFAALGVAGPLLQAVAELGYEEPTPIQRAAVPPLLAGRDVLGQAATGTGKTAAFALPVLQRLAAAETHGSSVPTRRRERPPVRALVLVPTRELAVQVAEAMHRYGRALPERILAIYGGQPIREQLAPLRHGVDVVVATPGRALDHVRRGSLALDAVEMIVLDEADEMLDMGFADDLDALLRELPAERQVALFSATLPRRIAVLAERHLRDPVRIAIPAERVAASDAPLVRHVAYLVHRREKIDALARVLDLEAPTSAIVFCRTRTEVDELTETLAARGYRCEPLHGGRAQEQRARVMRRFRDGRIDVLVATDVAARGLDVEHVSHVINFDVPCSTDAYVHRVGRTGRAGRSGVAITFAEPRERRLLRDVERVLAQRIRIAEVPTVDDVRARRLQVTAESLRAAIDAGALDAYRPIAAKLAAEFPAIDVASAALKLLHERGGAPFGHATAAPPTRPTVPSSARATATKPAPAAPPPTAVHAGAESPLRPPNRRERRAAARAAGLLPGPAASAASPTPARRSPEPRRRTVRAAPPATRLTIGLGKRAGLRPADLVGAIANEAGLAAHAIGAIDIGEQSATVEVPTSDAEAVVRALSRTTIRGRRPRVERSS